jgi:hypothetical protein
MRVKLYVTIDIDPDDYPIPADGDVAIEIEESIREYFYDIEGANIKSIKTLQE